VYEMQTADETTQLKAVTQVRKLLSLGMFDMIPQYLQREMETLKWGEFTECVMIHWVDNSVFCCVVLIRS
jgi:hypothetical protein